MSGFWQRTRPWRRGIIIGALLVLLVIPWVTDQRELFFVDHGVAVRYLGYVLFAAGYIGSTIVEPYLMARLQRSARLQLPLALVFLVLMGLGIPIYLFGRDAYAHARLALDRAAMERYVADGGACPTARCFADSDSKVAGFASAGDARLWSGICYDTEGVLLEAKRASREDRSEGKPRTPRVFGGVVYRAVELSPGWLSCGISQRRLGAPR